MRKVFILIAAMMLLAPMALAQTITPITDIQTPTDLATSDASPMAGQTVTVKGWVTFEPYSTGGSTFYVADAAGAWNGIQVYAGGLSENLGFGYHVQITGTVGERYGMTQISVSDVSNITVLSDSVNWATLPAACAYTEVSAADLGQQTPATAEQYEGTLVRIVDVTRNTTAKDFGEWFVEDASGNVVRIDNPADATYGYKHMVYDNQPYDYIQGVLLFDYSNYKIVPEISHDLKVAADGVNWFDQVSWFQQVRPADMEIRYNPNEPNNPFLNDESYASAARYNVKWGGTADPDTVVIRAVVTMPPGVSYAGAGAKIIVHDYTYYDAAGWTQQPWSSVLSYDPDATTFPNVAPGTEIIMKGEVSTYGNESHMTEIFVTEPVQTGATGLALPAPVELTIEEYRNPMIVEMWENSFIYMTGKYVSNNDPYALGTTYGRFVINDHMWSGAGVKVGEDSYWTDDNDTPTDPSDDTESPFNTQWDAFGTPPNNAVVDSVVGWVYNHRGDLSAAVDGTDDGSLWIYKLEPVNPATDIVMGAAPPTFVSTTRDIAVPGANQDVVVTSEVVDDTSVVNCEIKWTLEGSGTWNSVAMTNTSGDLWEGTIPGQASGLVLYFVEATDNGGSKSTAPSDTSLSKYGYYAKDQLAVEDVQYSPFPSGRSLYSGNVVTITGVVTNDNPQAEYFDDNDQGPIFYIQTGSATGAAWNGLGVFVPDDILPPTVDSLTVGDEITVTGMINETAQDAWGTKWAGQTLLSHTSSVSVNSSGNPVTAYDVTLEDLDNDPEMYESVLVRIAGGFDVTVANNYDWTFQNTSGTTYLIDDDMADSDDLGKHIFDTMDVGSTFDAVTGYNMWSFGTWKLQPRDGADFEGSSTVDNQLSELPREFELKPVYPNPFNPSTTIEFSLPHTVDVKLTVYNSLGRKVRTIMSGAVQAGHHTAMWNGRSDAGLPVSSGIYFLRLDAGENMQVRKMVLMK